MASPGRIRGLAAAGQPIHQRAALVTGARLGAAYEAHEFILPPDVMTQSLRTVVDHASQCSCGRATGAFSVVPIAAQVSVRNLGSMPILVRLNAPDSDPVTVRDLEFLYWTFVETTDVFLSNGSSVQVRVSVVLA